ncbi:MAG: Lrp/AsnC family transcriptional regulator [Pseudomonadota bacterium]
MAFENSIDQKDRLLLSALQENARLSFAELGERAGLSPSACHKRVKALEEGGVIHHYAALVSEDRAGLRTSVFVQATLNEQTEDALSRFEAAVARRPEITECYLMAGSSDYLMRVLCRDAGDFERVHRDVLTRLPGVARVMSNFAIRKVFRRSAVPLG